LVMYSTRKRPLPSLQHPFHHDFHTSPTNNRKIQRTSSHHTSPSSPSFLPVRDELILSVAPAVPSCQRDQMSVQQHQPISDSASQTPLFYSPLQRSFPQLMKEYLEDDDAQISTQQSLEPLHCSGRFSRQDLANDLDATMRSYLREFWRHDVERIKGKPTLWKEITGNPHVSGWFEAEADVYMAPCSPRTPNNSLTNSPSSTIAEDMTPKSAKENSTAENQQETFPSKNRPLRRKKTRWMEVAEGYFALMLEMDSFESNNQKHLRLLADLYIKSLITRDAELNQIIINYFDASET